MLGFLAKRKLELGEQINPTGQAAEEPLSFHSLSKKKTANSWPIHQKTLAFPTYNYTEFTHASEHNLRLKPQVCYRSSVTVASVGVVPPP